MLESKVGLERKQKSGEGDSGWDEKSVREEMWSWWVERAAGGKQKKKKKKKSPEMSEGAEGSVAPLPFKASVKQLS